jgi:protein-tyrosine phosphatase
MKPEIYWIETDLGYRIATMPRPRGEDWLRDEISHLKEDSLDHLVSLLTEDEIELYSLEQEGDMCSEFGIEFTSFPIDDHNTPDSKIRAVEVADRLKADLVAGRSVAVHCFAGIGRSSLMAALVLVRCGLDANVAFAAISKVRGIQVPDTDAQREWVVECGASAS